MLISLKRRCEEIAYFRKVEVVDVRKGESENTLKIDFVYEGDYYISLDAEWQDDGFMLNVRNPARMKVHTAKVD